MSGHIVKKEVTEEGEVSAAVTHIIIFFKMYFWYLYWDLVRQKKIVSFIKEKLSRKLSGHLTRLVVSKNFSFCEDRK